MAKGDLISVVMPCFNARRFLESAVHSALGQDYGNVELIVVDDGSSDGSQELLATLASRHPERLVVLHQPNQGPYPARNAGLGRARGSLVAFLDADDYWAPDCLRKLHDAMQWAQADVAYCGWQNVGDAAPGREPYVPPDYAAADPVALFLKSCPWPIHAALSRRSVLEEVQGFSTRMFTSMDYDLWLKVLAKTRHMVRVSQVLAFYRWHGEGQISSVKWRQVMDAWRVRREFARGHPQLVAHLAPATLQELLNSPLLRSAYSAYWKRDLASAQRLFREAARHGAWQMRDAKFVLPSFLPSALYRRLIAAADNR
jgi:glycosyltransferase involved in cell wall biosynthesis